MWALIPGALSTDAAVLIFTTKPAVSPTNKALPPAIGLSVMPYIFCCAKAYMAVGAGSPARLGCAANATAVATIVITVIADVVCRSEQKQRQRRATFAMAWGAGVWVNMVSISGG